VPRSRAAADAPEESDAPPGRKQRLHRGRTIEERRAERRAALLEAALELFGTKGYASTSIEEVCSTSFVTTRYFYEEFGNREGLLLALYDSVIERASLAVLAVDVPPGPDHVALATRARVSAFVHAVVDDERVARVLLLEQGSGSPALEARRREAHRFFARFVAEHSFAYLDAGEIVERDYEFLALLFVGAVNEAISDWVVTPQAERRDIEHVIDTVTEMYLIVRRGVER
jgi:AcrR family transcriptional regulator